MFSVKHDMDPQRVYDLIITGLECGELSSFRLASGTAYMGAWKSVDAGKIAEAYAGVEIEDRLSEDDAERKSIRLTDAALQAGLDLMSEKYPKHFADWLAENDDAITGDVFLQLVVFGEVIYG